MMDAAQHHRRDPAGAANSHVVAASDPTPEKSSLRPAPRRSNLLRDFQIVKE
jgi:hypothetical protein